MTAIRMSSNVKVGDSKAIVEAKADSVSRVSPMWRIVRGYILWSYERGTLHYDVMVTLILLFVFVSPHFINFKDKPVERVPHPIGLAIIPDQQGGFIYQIPAAAIITNSESEIPAQLEHIIEPISGAVTITRYEAVKDPHGHVQSYKVWVEKE
jgi:hypothetical protein